MLNDKCCPLYVQVTPTQGFTNDAISKLERFNLAPGNAVLSHGLAWFGAVTKVGCTHGVEVVGKRVARDLPQFKWVNTVLGNFKTMLSAAHKSSGHSKHAAHELGAFAYRLNRRFDLTDLWRNSSCLWSLTFIAPRRPRHG